MGCCKKFCLFSLTVLAVLIAYAVHSLYKEVPIPNIDQNQWWGPGKAKQINTSIRPFKVEFSPERITALKQKLSGTDWFTEPLEGTQFTYGFNGNYLKEVVDFWKNKYDFAGREKYLNKYPQFKTNIQGLDMHFIHIKQKPIRNGRVLPLLLLHGWPGSFVEFHKMIPLLTEAANKQGLAFDIIVPSLPGYGYSQGASKPGLGATQIAVIMKNLMSRLGYNRYVIQGGDWGSLITNVMAVLYPEHIYGYHTNCPTVFSGLSIIKLILGSIYPPLVIEKEYESKVYPIMPIFQNLLEGMGYMHIQATKPDTVGLGLKDSPVGLAAYILEKFSSWTNPEWNRLPDGGLTKKYSLTELLDNIMIYWDSQSITTSVRLYSESFNKAHMSLGIDKMPVKVPTAVSRFANEILFVTKWQMSDKYINLVQVSDFKTGGHFAAFEEPQLLANDILSAITKFDQYYQNKKDK